MYRWQMGSLEPLRPGLASSLATLACLLTAQGRVSKAVIDSGPPPGADVDSMPEKEADETADEDDVPVQVWVLD